MPLIVYLLINLWGETLLLAHNYMTDSVTSVDSRERYQGLFQRMVSRVISKNGIKGLISNKGIGGFIPRIRISVQESGF